MKNTVEKCLSLTSPSPRLDSIRGRRGDRDGTASKITKKQFKSVDVQYPTQTQPDPVDPRPRPRRRQTGSQGEKGSLARGPELSILPSARGNSLSPQIHSHNVSEPLIHKPRLSPTLLLTLTHTHLSHTHFWPAPPLLPLHAASVSVSGSIPHWHSPMERVPLSLTLSLLSSLPSSLTPFAPHMSATVGTRNLQSEIALLVQPIQPI